MADKDSRKRPARRRQPEVAVEGGEVTLAGTVESRDARWLAADLADSVTGVRAVHNRVAHA